MIKKIFQKFVDAGSDAKRQQLYDNVTNPPLITSSVEKLVIESLSVPELHLLLGKNKSIRNIKHLRSNLKQKNKINILLSKTYYLQFCLWYSYLGPQSIFFRCSWKAIERIWDWCIFNKEPGGQIHGLLPEEGKYNYPTYCYWLSF